MYCTHCGQENAASSNFCSGCGAKIPKINGALESEPSSSSKTVAYLSHTKKIKMSLLGIGVIFLACGLTFLLVDLVNGKSGSSSAESQSSADIAANNYSDANGDSSSLDDSINQNYPMTDETFDETYGDPGSYVWQHNLDMTGTGTWIERAPNEWKENVEQQYLFVNKVGCLFYVFDENSNDADVMNRAYQWLAQYSGVHIAGSNWILMDSSYGEKCTGPVTDTFGGYQVN